MVRSTGALAFVVAAAVAFALVVAGCATAEDKASWAADFEGTWSVVDYQASGRELSADDLAIVRTLGIYLNLDKGGTASLELMGDEIPATWEATADKVATIKVDEADNADFAGEDEMTIDAEGHLTLKSIVDSLTFERIDASQKRQTEVGSLVADGSDQEVAGGAPRGAKGTSTTTVTPASVLSNPSELDSLIASDDLVSIRVVAKGAYDGDPGYLFEVENKSDENLFVSVTEPLKVAGAPVHAHFEMGVNAHETGSEILWAGSDEAEGLEGATGTLVVTSADGSELSTYTFTL